MADEKKIDSRLPLSLHEAAISKCYARDPITREVIADRELDALHQAMAGARTAAQRVLDAHQAIMKDILRTPLDNARRSREVAFQHFDRAAREIDKSRARAMTEIARIEKETASPPEPTRFGGNMLEAEIRASIAAMKPQDRAKEIETAISDGDDLTVGACLRGPTFLIGLGRAEREALRDRWRRARFPNEIDRVKRLRAAIDALDRGSTAFLEFVGGLTDGDAIKKAEQAESSALAASRVA